MRHASIAILLLVGVGYAAAKLDGYCSICSDHTMCKYQGPGPSCEDIGEGGVSETEKRYIIDVHNWYRRIIARGYERRGVGGPQPSAANLMKFTWDGELASVAQRWADQCSFRHDECRDVSRWKVGQNLYWSWRIPVTTETNWTAAIESWYEEVAKFNPKTVQSYRFEAETGHYTQLIWHDTHLIGCGRRNYGPNKLYVCNYGPAGNWISDPVYKIGEACSQCPEGSTCDDGLCEAPKNPASTAKVSEVKPQPPPVQQHISKIINSLTPPKKNAPDNYFRYGLIKKEQDATANKFNLIDDSSLSALEEEVTTTEVPINFNIIDDLDVINNDEEIKKEIEELKLRILELARKIVEKRKSAN